jgi:hypothetical protein
MTNPEPAGSPGAPRRRRLQTEEKRNLPIGCMAWGGVLGILVGIMFALYAMPPILRSIYGPEKVASGETYNADAKQITVVDVTRDGDLFLVTLDFRTNKTFETEPADWKLEVATQDDWLEALPPDSAQPDTSLDFELGRERTLVLRFNAPERVDAEPVALHLADPRVRFALQPE